jgi:enoyl-CoA hydratase/carnithine racemase
MTLEIALTATARTALEYRTLGLVNRVCEPGTLHAATREFVSVLNDRAPWVLRRDEGAHAVPGACADRHRRRACDNQLLCLDNATAQLEAAAPASGAV